MSYVWRRPGTNRHGGAFDQLTILRVWQKGRIVPGYDGSTWRADACNRWMRYSDYGQTTEYGWEVDHVQPVAAGGSDHISNLQPLQWRVNRHKGDSWPNWYCPVAA
jgi:hypothetical protein